SGTWACFKSSANIAGPRLHLAHPWAKNPTPRIIRIGMGTHRCQRSLFSNSNMLIPFESLDLSCEEVADHRCDLCGMRFQREVPSVIKMHLRPGDIPLERFGAGWEKEGIILSPDRQQWWLVFAEIFLELRIERHVACIILKEIELHFVSIGTSQVKVVQGAAIRRDYTWVGDAMGVLESRRFRLEKHAQSVAIRLGCILPVGANRVPTAAYPPSLR